MFPKCEGSAASTGKEHLTDHAMAQDALLPCLRKALCCLVAAGTAYSTQKAVDEGRQFKKAISRLEAVIGLVTRAGAVPGCRSLSSR